MIGKMFRSALGLGLAAAAGLAGAQVAVPRLVPGTPVSGELKAGDKTMADGSYTDCYRLVAPAGATVTVTLRSTAFETYLIVGRGAQCNFLASYVTADEMPDDDHVSRVIAKIEDGTYWVKVNTNNSEGEGAYSLEASAN